MTTQNKGTMEGGGKNEYDILKVQVYSRKAKRLPEKDFTLKFIKTKASTKDLTKRFDKYMNNGYIRYFEQYLIPTVIKHTYITSTTVSPYKELPKNTIIAFERPGGKNPGMNFNFGDYQYTMEGKEFNVKYIGKNKTEITTYPFGGFSEYKVNYSGCYANLKITDFDFSKLMMDMCVSTERMFYNCPKLVEIKNFAPHLQKIPLMDMTEMFALCSSLSKIDLSELNQSFNLYNVQRMFYACVSLQKIDITGMKLTGKYGEDADESSIFAYCYGLREIVCMKDQLLLIRESLPTAKLWIDARIYKNSTRKEESGKSGSSSKKTKKLTMINTLFKDKLIVKNLDRERSLLLVKNETRN